MITNLFIAARACLDTALPDDKVALSRETAHRWREGHMELTPAPPPQVISSPGRPDRPRLVPPARGLDVTPGMMERLRNLGDERTVSILEIILRDEVGHVAIGSRWFRHACAQRGLEPERTFRDLLQEYMKGRIKGPFHEQARSRAGFSDAELAELKRQAGIHGE